MNSLRSLLLFFLVLPGLMPPLAIGAAETAPLRVGVTPLFPPMIYKEGGQFAGVEVDFANAIGKELGRRIQLVEVRWEDQIEALSEGRTDIIMSSMSITRARQLRAEFCQPYLRIGQMALIRREDGPKYALGFPLAPEGAIGVIKGTTGDFVVQQEFVRSKRKEMKAPEQAAKALLKGQVNLFICDSPVIWWLAGTHEAEGLAVVPIVLSEERLAWAVRRSDPALLEAVNGVLAKLQKDGRADGIIRRWIPLFR